MIKHILVIIDKLDDETEFDILEALSVIPDIDAKTDLIVTDSVKSAISTMQVMSVQGLAN